MLRASLVLLLLIFLALAGAQKIRLGRTISTLGSQAAEAGSIINGTNFAVDYINSNGGVNVNGTIYNFTLVTWEDASQPTLVKRLYEDMISRGEVDALLGPWSTLLTTPAVSVAASRNFPMVFSGASSTALYNVSFNSTFGTAVQAGKRSLPCAIVFQQVGVKSAVFVSSDDPFQILSQSLMIPQLTSRNISFLANYTVSRLLTTPEELGTSPADVIAADADLLVLCMATTVATVFLQELRKYKWNPKAIYITNSETVQLVEKAIGWGIAGGFAGNQWSPRLPYNDSDFDSAAGYGQQYQAKYGQVPTFWAAASSAAVFVLKDAIERAGAFDRDSLIFALKGTAMRETFFGPISFLPTGELNGSCACEQMQDIAPYDQPDRKMQTIYPSLLADTTVIYPAIPDRPPGPSYFQRHRRAIIIGSSVAGFLVFLGLLAGFYFGFIDRKYLIFLMPKKEVEGTDSW